MSKPIIKINNLSKMYRLGEVGTGTLSHDLKRWYYRMRGWEDPYLKIGEANDRNTKSKSDYIWALKNINLEIMPGEVLGIIGKNGAGKSTLLKILSKVTGPTTGNIHYNGRIGALLEVGTGFHQELTGRENIFLNGAILGMTKAEIRGKIDEIIDFSGVERYIDTPVKRYSSGMMVRLGFAVAAHLEPEILVVDEVLAVGDAEFQKKAIGKMQDVSKIEGKTVLFVSHNMQAIKTLCDSAILIKNGEIANKSKSDEIVLLYLRENIVKTSSNWIKTNDKPTIHFSKISFVKLLGEQPNIRILLKIEFDAKELFKECLLAFDILDDVNVPIFQTITNRRIKFKKGRQNYKVEIILPPLIPGDYYISAWIGPHNTETYDFVKNVISFSIYDSPIQDWTFPFSKNHGHLIMKSILLDEKNN